MNKRLFYIVATLVVGCAVNGCVTYVMYTEGRITDHLNEPLQRVFNASVAALEEQKLAVNYKRLIPPEGHINAEYPGGDIIRIDMKKKSENITVIHIRIGWTGSKPQEIALLDSIKKHLQPGAPAAR